MSQDPNSIYGRDPQNPYGAPQDPYNTPPQTPSGDQPQSPYNTSQQNPYGPPPQQPYGAPPPTPYGAPPQGGPYGPYGPQGYGPGPNAFTPLPLSEAVRQLPKQYIKVLTRPSATTFAQELPKAGWDITWIQLLIYAVIRVVIGLIAVLIASSIVRANLASTPYASIVSLFTIATTVGGALLEIITVPLEFFINNGVQYLLARAFGGQGNFLGQSYTNLLFTAPLNIIANIVSLLLLPIPIVGKILLGIIGLAQLIYSTVLNIFQIQASHRLTGGKATAAVLLTYLIYFVVGLLCIVAFVFMFAVMYRSTMPQY